MENRVRRAVIMAEGNRIAPADLELEGPVARLDGRTLKEAREELERELVQRALSRHKGNISQAARQLGISCPTLYELMEKLGIRQPGQRHYKLLTGPCNSISRFGRRARAHIFLRPCRAQK